MIKTLKDLKVGDYFKMINNKNKNMEFKKFIKNTEVEMVEYNRNLLYPKDFMDKLSISLEDKKNGSPKNGDMIARNPNNHDDMWLVSKEYFEQNYTQVKENNFTQRIEKEKEDLSYKIVALTKFIADNPIFKELSYNEQELMREQLVFMRSYRNVLEKRLQILKNIVNN